MKKNILILLLFSIFLLNYVHAVDVSVSPAAVNISDMLRGGFAQRTFRIRTFSQEDISVLVYLDQNSQRANEYLSFNPPLGTYNISRDTPLTLDVTIEPGTDAESLEYLTYLRFNVLPQNNTVQGTTALQVQTSVAAKIAYSITQNQKIVCRTFYEKITSAEQGDFIYFTNLIINDGNVQFAPRINLEFWDISQTNLIKTVVKDDLVIRPTLQRENSIEISTSDLPSGQYWLKYEIEECSSQGILTFDVLRPGELKAQGNLLYIKNKVWVEIDENVPIMIAFENIGEDEVNARFVGQVKLDGKILKEIQTPTQIAKSGETIIFEDDFTPKKSGIYEVTGRIYYAGKITTPYTSKINVNPGKQDKSLLSFEKLYPYLIGVIAFLLVMGIINKKRKMRS